MVVHRLKPVHFLAGMAWLTFFGSMWLVMLGHTTWASVIAPMIISFVIAVLAAFASLVN